DPALSGERVAHQNRVVALGRRRDQRDRAADQLLYPSDIFDRARRQVGPAARAAGRAGPALDLLVDRLDPRLIGGVRRQIVERLTVEPVAGTDTDRLELVEHVELGQRDPGHAADRDRLAHQHRVKPAAAPLPPGHRAELVAALAELLADLIVLLGGE